MVRHSLQLEASHEWVAHDPFGNLKGVDQSPLARVPTDASGRVVLCAPRNGYASFRALVHGQGEYRLSASIGGDLEIDLFKAWYHRMRGEPGQPPTYWPDALVPLRDQQVFQLPDPDNQVEGQTTQLFWVDVYVPLDAPPGEVGGEVRLVADGGTRSLPVRVHVLDAALPDQPCITIDHNSYGARWLFGMYPRTFGAIGDAAQRWYIAIELLHHYYRLVHEHRGLFHNLGYGHSGAFDPIYGPRTEGQGREKALADWALYDRHYGPLLDGSAFDTAAPGMPRPRRAARPIQSVYTPINPDWPASYLWWGERGYEVEFTRCVGQFDAHLRERGWTGTNVELFFNHKKRYRWFGWDGDEVKYLKDMHHHGEMVRLWEAAVGDTPVPWVYRSDASWQMVNQFEWMAGHMNFWVCGGFHRWYPVQVRRVIERGDIVWWYGGTPPVGVAACRILSPVYQTWARGLHGYCAWLTTDPGPDPWFDCTGAATGLLYPGERFGIPGPIPSIRLKVQRNGIQDIDLIDQAAKMQGGVRAARRALIPQVPIKLWQEAPRAAQELPPEEWDSRNLAAGERPQRDEDGALDPFWWQAVRDHAYGQEHTG